MIEQHWTLWTLTIACASLSLTAKLPLRNRWYLRAFVALSIALLCILTGRLLSNQGWHTSNALGYEFGFARIKALSFVVWKGELFRLPFDWFLAMTALVATAVAIATTWEHFR